MPSIRAGRRSRVLAIAAVCLVSQSACGVPDRLTSARAEGPAVLWPVGAGETWDVLWTPAPGATAVLQVTTGEGDTIRQALRVGA